MTTRRDNRSNVLYLCLGHWWSSFLCVAEIHTVVWVMAVDVECVHTSSDQLTSQRAKSTCISCWRHESHAFTPLIWHTSLGNKGLHQVNSSFGRISIGRIELVHCALSPGGRNSCFLIASRRGGLFKQLRINRPTRLFEYRPRYCPHDWFLQMTFLAVSHLLLVHWRCLRTR